MPFERSSLTPARRRLVAFASAAIVATLGLAVAASFMRVRDSRRWVAHSQRSMLTAASLLQRLTDAETGQRGFIITGDTAYLAPYAGAKADVFASLARLRALASEDPEQQPLLDSLEQVVARRFTVLDGRVDIRRRFGFDSASTALRTGSGLALMTRARAQVDSLRRLETAHLDRRIAAEASAVRLLFIVLALGTILAAIVAMMLNDLLVRHALAEQQASRALADQNARLQEQALELELQQQQLQEQAMELEAQAAELEAANEELQATTEELEQRSVAADHARREAESANRAKAEFLTTMSHELRTPLNAIEGYSELLALGVRGPLSEAQLTDLQRIRSNGRYLLGLVNDILNFARLEAGQLDFRPEPVALRPFLEQLEPLVAPQVHRARLSYEAVVEGEAPAWADPEKLRQIVLNLITNAIKFTPEGGRLTVRCTEDAEVVRLTVSDTGVGIPADKLGAIFEPFVQVDRYLNKTSQQGVGLGLAISRDLARRMGGDLTVESVLGAGAAFTLVLPRVSSVASPHGAYTDTSAKINN